MNKALCEGNLQFEFLDFLRYENFDLAQGNPNGLYPVDFFAEDNNHLYFIEVKDFQHPKSTNSSEDFNMLLEIIDTGSEKVKSKPSELTRQTSTKIKDSLLRRYASGEKMHKKVIYLLLINCDKLGANERLLIYEKMQGAMPTGLNNKKFCAFKKFSFYITDVAELAQYKIVCTPIQ